MTSVEQVLIERHPGVAGGNAVVRGTRIPVWVLVDFYEIFDHDLDTLVRNYPSAGREGVLAALAYYDTHRDEIDAERAANDAMFDELDRLDLEGTVL